MEKILEITDLKKYFLLKKTRGYVKAVDGVNLSIRKGEVLGLVGESGCGKTTLGKTIGRLLRPTGGSIFFKEKDISHIEKKELKLLRKDIQIVFQNPKASIDPRMPIAKIIAEPLTEHRLVKDKKELNERIFELISEVGLKKEHLSRFRHAFSGGQLQRISIARTLAMNPEVIILDEPTSALDVSVQAKILKLLKKLQNEYDLTYIFISHDLAVISVISDRIAVMYLGKIVELADTKEIFDFSMHPYTWALINSNPKPIPRRNPKRILLTGEIPSPINPPSGCSFHPRCQFAQDICRKGEAPPLTEVKKGHFVRCHFPYLAREEWSNFKRKIDG
jgi:oligopeptide/dipeptide ABC transporter ATP-binding protein